MCGEGMAQRMRRCRFDDTRVAHRLFHGALYAFFVHMMTARHAGTWIDRKFGGGKDVLPAPLARGCRPLRIPETQKRVSGILRGAAQLAARYASQAHRK